ncbi:MAG: hypothetical protein QXI60_00955 [Thermofilaceae archaeon]
MAYIAAALIPVGLAMLLLSALLESHVLKLIGYGLLFAALIYVAIFILAPLVVLAFGLAYRGGARRAVRRAWEQNRYMLLALGVQCVTAYFSILLHVFTNLDFWLLIGLYLLNTFLLVNLAGECYNYTAMNGDAGIAVIMLGNLMYGLYVATLLEEFGAALPP